MSKLISIPTVLLLISVSFSCGVKSHPDTRRSVKEVMDDVITRLYQEVPSDKYQTVDDDFIMDFLSNEEKHVLATQYQYFKVNVPVTVSLMRHVGQKNIPFWMQEAGFVKTNNVVQNEVYEYEVWQKDFDTGWINLGINGFDMHRPVYFICVGPQEPNDKLVISDHYPEQYPIMTLKEGAFTYHDWSGLVIRNLPAELEGQSLFTTVRGRAREAHVKGAFRETLFPSVDQPDQILLTWSDDPKNTQSIQWRTSTSVSNAEVKYWKKNDTDTLTASADKFVMEDRMLYNDRYVHRFTSGLTGLDAGTTYEYTVGSNENIHWSDVMTFTTQAENQDQFSFIWFGDTHHSKLWGDLLQVADQKHPEVAFYSIAGDLVTTGLYRNEWDDLFGFSGEVFARKPLMPVPGNHDRQDGLGAWMYYEMFDFPKDAPTHVHPESTYAFTYGNALFLMIDSTHPIEEQSEWIEEKLRNSDAVWKFAMFHFPPYNFEEPYPDIQNAWCTIFDRYHVDMVMAGHVHYYMRSKPMFDGNVVNSFQKGTVYATSIGINGNHDDIGQEPYAEVRYKDGQFYQHMSIDGHKLVYRSYNGLGEISDEFVIDKSLAL